MEDDDIVVREGVRDFSGDNSDFVSSVYSSFEEMAEDLYWIGKDPYLQRCIVNGVSLTIPRQAEETNIILKNRKLARVRYDLHKKEII